jgi:hypothetical protein
MKLLNSGAMRFRFFTIVFLTGIARLHAQVPGCTDPLASNYNPAATVNDGSCLYGSTSVSSVSTFTLDSALTETSGLIGWGDYIWTHNDNNDINLYGLDTASGGIMLTYALNGITNTDWEEISQDSAYIYIGDFGNNANGNRTDLHILRILKNSLLINNPHIDTIGFSYCDQADFSPAGSNHTDFDCEAFVVSADSIYLFTKQWLSNQTKIYSLPKIPGTYTATLQSACDVQGLVTGATYLEPRHLIVLCGYSNMLQPFLYLLYDFPEHKFASGNKRKISVSLPFHQTEGIATTDGRKFWVSNEQFIYPPYANVEQQLHIFDLGPYLGTYLQGIMPSGPQNNGDSFTLYPNPANERLEIKTDIWRLSMNYIIYDSSGRQVIKGRINETHNSINIRKLSEGIYYFRLNDQKAVKFSVSR